MQQKEANIGLEQITKDALAALDNQNFTLAQELFKKSARLYPCLDSMHNLGNFYVNEGIEFPSGQVRSAKKLGMRYLLRGKAFGISYKNLMSIGVELFNGKSFQAATEYFLQADTLYASFYSQNNLGAALYNSGNTVEANICFNWAFNHCTDEYKDIVWLSLAFTSLNHSKEECLALLEQENSIELESIDLEKFQLFFLCGDLHSAANLILNVWNYYVLDEATFAMLLECLIQLGRTEEADEYLSKQICILSASEYSVAAEVALVRRLRTDFDFRKSYLANFHYAPVLIKGCYYIGCKKHPYNELS